jgi:hypothetical protein
MQLEIDVKGIDPEHLYDLRQVSKMINRSRNWLYQECYRGNLRCADLGGARARLVPGQAVIEYIHDRILKFDE